MKQIILFTTHCPRCNILKAKLDKARIKYIEEEDVNRIAALGIEFAPALMIDEKLYDFKQAVDWVNSKINGEY